MELGGEVRARLCHDKPVVLNNLEQFDDLRPVQHSIPDLPVRNFFGPRFGAAVYSKLAMNTYDCI